MYKHILVPLDLEDIETARPAIARAVELAKTSGGTVHLLHVLSLTPVMLAEYVPADFDTNQQNDAQAKLTALVEEAGLPGRITSAVRQGGIYHEILEEAKAIGADLIVMTSHRPAMRTYFLGSNAGHVVRYATCSVLVVRD
ncbi:MAG TPA: universal stress protein [Pseudolabrys sp.]|nr:universal stress protein [Pseudolabrys sp.]